MATKLENYVHMAGLTAAEITRNRENWTAFLRTASRLYRYSFPDQLLIHAQRPQATACAEFDLWNKRMRRYIRRGSKGIGLVNVNSGRPVIRYVFDTADTGKRKDACDLYLWQYKDEYQECISAVLEKYYGASGSDGITVQLCHTATKIAKDYWENYHQDIMYEAEGSLLEELDEQSLRS